MCVMFIFWYSNRKCAFNGANQHLAFLFGGPDDNYPKCKCAQDGEDSMFSIDVAKKVQKFFPV